MSDADPATPPDELDDAACQRALAILVDVGTALALECKAKDAPHAARTLAYDRVALAVRRAIILSQHIAHAGPAREAKAAADAAARQAKAAADDAARAERRRQVLRGAQNAIQRKAAPEQAAALRLELVERIDSPEFDEDLAKRSPAAIIIELCNDMGLGNFPGTRPELRRTPDDITILCAQAAAPAGSGLPRWFALADADPAPEADTHDLQ